MEEELNLGLEGAREGSVGHAEMEEDKSDSGLEGGARVVPDMDAVMKGGSRGKEALCLGRLFCQPKENGGLDIKNLSQYNKALLLGQTWDLSLKKDSMWIKWMSNYIFKNQSFWSMEEKIHQTWVQKKNPEVTCRS
ncbi:hypothetical protein QQ045_013105 [Rhodiola kirilowii]